MNGSDAGDRILFVAIVPIAAGARVLAVESNRDSAAVAARPPDCSRAVDDARRLQVESSAILSKLSAAFRPSCAVLFTTSAGDLRNPALLLCAKAQAAQACLAGGRHVKTERAAGYRVLD
jgi:hypothetical protein